MIKFKTLIVGMQYSTTDYTSLFANPVPGNREVEPREVSRKVQSIKSRGQMANVIMTAKGELVDGQHRIKACEQLGIPVNFIITGNKQPAAIQVATTNSFLSKWAGVKHVDMAASRGVKGFKILKEVMDNTGLVVGHLKGLGVGITHGDQIHYERPLDLIPDKEIRKRAEIAASMKEHYCAVFDTPPRQVVYNMMGRMFDDPTLKLTSTDWKYINSHIRKVCMNPRMKSQPRLITSNSDALEFFNAAFNFSKSAAKKHSRILATK